MANEKPVNYIVDARLDSGGYQSLTCIVGHWTGDPTHGALLFSGIDIDRGENFDMCRLIYKYGGVGGSGQWKIKVRGIDEDNTGWFDSGVFGRAKTDAQITLDEGQPTSGGSKDFDVKDIVREITSRSNWNRFNNLGFIMEDNGSSSNVYAAVNEAESYLVYRIGAQPNFKPSPASVAAPSFPAATDAGMIIAKPGISIFDATDDQVLLTTRKKVVKVLAEGEVTSSSSGNISVMHSLGYVPLVSVYGKGSYPGDQWVRLPIAGGDQYYFVNSSTLYLHASTSGQKFYYRIFVDKIKT